MKKLTIIFALMLAGWPAFAFFFFPTSPTTATTAAHADNVDNDSSTNVNFAGSFQGTFATSSPPWANVGQNYFAGVAEANTPFATVGVYPMPTWVFTHAITDNGPGHGFSTNFVSVEFAAASYNYTTHALNQFGACLNFSAVSGTPVFSLTDTNWNLLPLCAQIFATNIVGAGIFAIDAGDNVTATSYSGNGSGLTGLSAGQVAGSFPSNQITSVNPSQIYPPLPTNATALPVWTCSQPIFGQNYATINNTFYAQYMVAGQSATYLVPSATFAAGATATATNLCVFLPMMTTNASAANVNWNMNLGFLTNNSAGPGGWFNVKNANVTLIGSYTGTNVTVFKITNAVPFSFLTNMTGDMRLGFYNNGTTNFYLFSPTVTLAN